MSFARVRALAVIGLLSMVCVVFVIVAMVRDSQAGGAAGCPEGQPLADLVIREPRDIRITVLNGTDRPGLAHNVADDFRDRGFQVKKEATDKKRIAGVAVLQYGPKGVSSAQLLQAYFLNEAERKYDTKRDDDTVDVVLGGSFQQLAAETDMRLSLGELGRPTAPPGACPSPLAGGRQPNRESFRH